MNAGASGHAVSWREVHKSYALDWRGRSNLALNGLSLELPQGAICTIAGPNGSGKSTLLKIAADLVKPQSGDCLVFGSAPKDALKAGQVAFLAEDPVWPDFDTLHEWLVRLAQISGKDESAALTRAEQVLRQLGLRELADRPCRVLSKGQRQRLGLAQALLRNPTLLLLDEPMTGLDPHRQEELIALLTELRTQGCTIALTAHFLPHSNEWCDYLVIVVAGRVVFIGDRAAVKERGGWEKIYRECVP